MLTKIQILEAVMAKIQTKYPKSKPYMGEVVDGFRGDSFFCELVKTAGIDNKNTTSNTLSIIITYLPTMNKQAALLTVEDDLEDLFMDGFAVADRFLTVQSITSVRLGEKQHTIQITMAIEYKDSTGYDPDSGFDLMETVDTDMTLNERTKENGN
jgi:hypothetical protein